jgi:hypothetical protein
MANVRRRGGRELVCGLQFGLGLHLAPSDGPSSPQTQGGLVRLDLELREEQLLDLAAER